MTLWLEPNKGSLPNYLPGQHLPIEVNIDGKKVGRRYTLSSSPSRPGRYAISVKRKMIKASGDLIFKRDVGAGSDD